MILTEKKPNFSRTKIKGSASVSVGDGMSWALILNSFVFCPTVYECFICVLAASTGMNWEVEGKV